MDAHLLMYVLESGWEQIPSGFSRNPDDWDFEGSPDPRLDVGARNYSWLWFTFCSLCGKYMVKFKINLTCHDVAVLFFEEGKKVLEITDMGYIDVIGKNGETIIPEG